MSPYFICPKVQYQPYDCDIIHVHAHVYIRSFDKLIRHTIGLKRFLFGTAQLSLWARWRS